MKINERGFWENPTSEGQGIDESIGKAMLGLFRSFPTLPYVIDIGCGDGWYTKYLNDNGIPTVGYDGNPHTLEICGMEPFGVADFSMPQWLGLYDFVISLDVGDRIPREYEDIFLDNLAKHAKYGIIMSWAIPGQDGDGHVNCQSNRQIINKMAERGFALNPNRTNYLRNATSNCYWLEDTIMYFERSLT